MKKKTIYVVLIILCLLLAFAVQIPYKTVITTETLSSVRNNDESHPEVLNNAISKSLFAPMSYPTFVDSIYVIQEEYLIKKDKTTYFVPYIMADVRNVGTAGMSTWTFWLNTLVVEEDGTTTINSSKKYNRSASTFTVEADPNTFIREVSSGAFFDDCILSIVLNKKEWSAMDEHVFFVEAVTLDSSKPRNADSIASFRWESSLSYGIGKTVPFVVEASTSYMNNCKGN